MNTIHLTTENNVCFHSEIIIDTDSSGGDYQDRPIRFALKSFMYRRANADIQEYLTAETARQIAAALIGAADGIDARTAAEVA